MIHMLWQPLPADNVQLYLLPMARVVALVLGEVASQEPRHH